MAKPKSAATETNFSRPPRGAVERRLCREYQVITAVRL